MLQKLNPEFSIRDPIHGFVRLNKWEMEIINHRWFQRLRRIKQLAFTDYVYPGASHSRFEHSLGVMHLATQLYETITEKCQPELMEHCNITEAEWDSTTLRGLVLLRLAAMLHDIGHGPYSHSAEAVYPSKDGSNKKYKHEDYSRFAIQNLVDLIDCYDQEPYLRGCKPITASEVSGVLDKQILNPEDVQVNKLWAFIRSILDGPMDADKLDYLVRDSYHAGVTYGKIDVHRIVESATWGFADYYSQQESIQVSVALPEDDLTMGESLAVARYFMYNNVYFHHTRRAFDLMYSHALKLMLVEGFPPPTSVENLEAYFNWDDYRIMGELFNTHSSLPLYAGVNERKRPSPIKECHSTKWERLWQALTECVPIEFCYRDNDSAVPSPHPIYWLDTGASVSSYSYDNEILLRPKDDLQGSSSKAPILQPLSASAHRSKLAEALAKRMVITRVYCIGDDNMLTSVKSALGGLV